ncbi:DUF4232 domain-containing protein [Streptomyces sp. NPDC093094]|uniref:DUF4232 domain-containing protein n=1 Tax=Streptomyces sp. NPDC093094 TaxID=3366026 RepID=UPI0038298B55
MRAVRTTVTLAATALAATLALTACDSGGGEGGGDAKSASGGACAIGGVDIEVGPANAAPAAGDSGNVPVTVTNKGTECTLNGFPAVGLSADGDPVAVPADKAAKATEVTLAEGAAVSFTLTYVRGEAGADSLDARTLSVGLPGGSETRSFPWSYGPVAGAGTPEASVTAFQQAGD